LANRTQLECDYHAVVTDTNDSFGYLSGRCRALGFDFCATGIRLPLPIAEPKTILENNYSPAWQAEYEGSNYVEIDPTIAHALSQVGPAYWSDTYDSAPDFWESAFKHDLRNGISIATRHSSGALGMLSVARGDNEISLTERRFLAPELLRLTEMFGVTKFAKTVERLLPEATALLTPREKEVLRWTADGKTSEDIGKILSVSVNTINFHVKQSLGKLNALNKTQAVVKALLLGLI
jgi:LuxR family quorum-sensing system transcriptional regulator SolR